jgi:predicted adenylyl cyclase CyaB
VLVARNIEIKARIDSVEAWIDRVGSVADSGPAVIVQDDTFFHCPRGRLKLRVFDSETGELIHYHRPNQAGPKESSYSIVQITSASLLREVLSSALGQFGRVRKRRTLFLAGRTRIHLDRVEGLGDFLELEVVLSPEEPSAKGVDEAMELLARLNIPRASLIEGAYLDLLQTPGRCESTSQ